MIQNIRNKLKLQKKIAIGITIILSFFISVISLASEPKIDDIELYLINVDVQRHFSYGVWSSRQHLMLRVKAGEFDGWGEAILTTNKPNIDLKKTANDIKKAIGKTPSEILEEMKSNRKYLPWHPFEALNMALWDIKGKYEKKPSVELIGLSKKDPVNGMFCILENDPLEVAKQANIAKKEKLTNVIKLKVFGDIELDCKLVSVLRKSMGDKCFIVADANHGYKNFTDLQDLANTLKRLSEAGLNALEDPANLSDEELITLQKKCRSFGLSLIPDVNLRPAWRALAEAPKGMGDFYNLHPGCMVDLLEMAKLANKINSWNTRIMIGDDSLIGAACTIYQQIAVACGAAWVEALEKPQESAVFTDCIIEKATYRQPNGMYAVKPNIVGWGLKVDSDKLKNKASRWISCKKQN